MSLQEVHYCSLQSQSNVYGLAKMCVPHGQHKLLVASLRSKVMSLEFQKTRPSSREVPFTYIPGDAEKVSIDAFNKLQYGNGVVVGITFVKTAENTQSQFLNIYSDTEPGSEFDLDSIAQAAQNIELKFVPYQLYHTELAHGGSVEMVFLISGNDKKVHIFREDRYHHIFSEVDDANTKDFFPEFSDIPSNITWMSCKSFDDYHKRITAYGCQDGTISATYVDTETKDLIKKWSIQHDGPITCLKLFSLHTEVHTPSFVSQVIEIEEDGSEAEAPDLHLIVTSALEPTVVYRSILDKGFSDPVVLPDSDMYDSVLSTTVADVDFDGQNEILIGTYGQELLIYKHQQKQQSGSDRSSLSAQGSSESLLSPITDKLSTYKSEAFADGDYRLVDQKSFADPILAITEVDITGDGLKEIAVLSLKGLHILQHDLKDVSKLCLERMKQATQHRSEEDVFEQLLSETLT